MIEVKGTYREDGCDSRSGIAGLVLAQAYNGYTVHDLASLKPLADARQLEVRVSGLYAPVPVFIVWSNTWGRYIATTLADGRQCNNLLSLPIYFPSSKSGTVTTYSQCSI